MTLRKIQQSKRGEKMKKKCKRRMWILTLIMTAVMVFAGFALSVLADNVENGGKQTAEEEQELYGRLTKIGEFWDYEDLPFNNQMTIESPESPARISKAGNTSMETAEEIYSMDIKNINLSSADMTLFYKFTPEKTGFYTFMSYGGTECVPYITVEGEGIGIIKDEDSNYLGNHFKIVCHLDAGRKYYIELGCCDSKTGSFLFTMVHNQDLDNETFPDANSSSEISIFSPGKREIYSYTPASTGTYTVKSTGNVKNYGAVTITSDPLGWVYNSSLKLIASDDNSGENENFSMKLRLNEGETYYIVAGCTREGQGSFYLKIDKPSNIPSKPSTFMISGYSENSVSLIWPGLSLSGDRWLIQYRIADGEWVNAAVVTGGYGYTVGGLTPSKEYELRMFVENGSPAWSGTWSPASDTVTAKLPPAQPTNLSASNITESTVQLKWQTAEPHGANRWLIQYRVSGGSWVNAGTSSSKAYTVTGLRASQNYEFRVYSEAGSTAWSGNRSRVSNIAKAMTLPARPTNLRTSNITEDSVRLNWNTIDAHWAERWLIQYRVAGGSWMRAGRSTSKTFTMTGLRASQNYEFRVYSETGSPAWEGTWSIVSNTVSCKTLPSQPENLRVSITTDTTVKLKWDTHSPAHWADRWLIQYRIPDGSWKNAGTSTSKEYTVSGLDLNKTYEFRVYSEAGSPAWSGTRSIESNIVRSKTVSVSTLQTAFTEYGKSINNKWGIYGLQCVHLSEWFISNYTTLTPGSGDGKDWVAKLLSNNPDADKLKTSTTPTAFSVFSVKEGYEKYGSTGTDHGHTGIVLSIDEGTKKCVILNTGNLRQGKDPNSWIETCSYAETAGLTFVDISAYLN